jgi:peptide/nickel transport system substrate-binding protein
MECLVVPGLLYNIFCGYNDSLPAVSSRVYGIQPGPAGIKWNFTDWFVPKQLQRYTAN